MKTKRYDKIRGREALKRVLEGERIYDINCVGEATAYFLNDKNEFCGEYKNRETFVSGITVDEAVRLYDWYVKKPFDVRAEMLARPNEWVGAYGDEHGIWKVGFNTVGMSVVTSQPNGPNGDIKVLDYLFSKDGFVRHSSEELLDACIPIEEVPEGAWS